MLFTIIDDFPEGFEVFSLLVIQAKFAEQLKSINWLIGEHKGIR